MKIHLHASVFFENWDFRNAESGIGGSEQHQVDMAWRLARRGYEVVSYSPLREDSPPQHLGVKWKEQSEADFSEPGIWVLYRNPLLLDKFESGRDDQRIWFVAQDEHYGRGLTEERAAKVEKFCLISPWQVNIFKAVYPFLRPDQIALTANGIKMDLIRELEREGLPDRNPNKCIYTSSPDRGLEALIRIFGRSREWVPDLELHVYYGLDNIEKLIVHDARFAQYKALRDRILEAVKAPGINYHGRISQRELYREIFSAGMWTYPTEFGETSCINCMEAQAMGAIPVTNPYGALETNVDHGISIRGRPYSDRLVSARYSSEIVRLARQPELQDHIRSEMMRDSRARFNWERVVDQWSNWIEGLPTHYHSQFQFQGRHMTGKALNIGCGDDPMDFKSRGAFNVDISEKGPVGNVVNKPDLVLDARLPLPVSGFDSVILGDILEHMTEDDAVTVMRNARNALANGGPVIITCPNDTGRAHTDQHKGSRGDEVYAENISAFHDRAITRKDLKRMIEKAGLRDELWQLLDYTEFEGYGVVCRER